MGRIGAQIAPRRSLFPIRQGRASRIDVPMNGSITTREDAPLQRDEAHVRIHRQRTDAQHRS